MKKLFQIFMFMFFFMMLITFSGKSINKAIENKNFYTVTFVDIEKDPDETDGTYEIPAFSSEAPKDYHFYCWALNEYDGVRYFPGDTINISDDIELIPVFTHDALTEVSAYYKGGTLKVGEKLNLSLLAIFAWDEGYNYYFDYRYQDCHFYYDNELKEEFNIEDWKASEEGYFNYFVTTEAYQGYTVLCLEVDNNVTRITVSFDKGEGTGSMSSITQSYDAEIIFPECEFKAPAGMRFSYWTIDYELDHYSPENEIKYLVEEKSKVNHVLHAHYEPIPSTVRTITFDAAGGTGIMLSEEVDVDTYYELPLCKFKGPDGKGFLFWEVHSSDPLDDSFYYEGSRIKAGESILIDRDITLSVIWDDEEESDIVSISVFYNNDIYQGNTMELNDLEVELNSSSKGTIPILGNNPKLSFFIDDVLIDPNNYAFNTLGSIELKITYEDNFTFVSVNVIEAPANLVSYSYNGNGGKGSMAGNNVTIGTTIIVKEYAMNDRTGYIFICWSANKAKGDESSYVYPLQEYTINVDTVFYAQWIKENNVTFNKGLGFGSMSPITIMGSYTLPECEFKAPSNHKFVGWEVNGKMYQPGENIQVLDEVVIKAIFERTDGKTKANGALIAFIIILSIFTVGIGGFAVYWFAIKKKTFNDFLNLFKKQEVSEEKPKPKAKAKKETKTKK